MFFLGWCSESKVCKFTFKILIIFLKLLNKIIFLQKKYISINRHVFDIPTKNLLIKTNGLLRKNILIFYMFHFFEGHRRVKGQIHNGNFLLV
jgi:hypothetical protein